MTARVESLAADFSIFTVIKNEKKFTYKNITFFLIKSLFWMGDLESDANISSICTVHISVNCATE